MPYRTAAPENTHRGQILALTVKTLVQDLPWGRFVFFSDPDGNGWAAQQLPDRA